MISQAISHYRIIKKLGAGGMGEVYLAEDTKLNRKVAIKFLPPKSTADEQAKKRLLREARAAAALDHTNICAIHEVGEEEGLSFIVMQYVEGETLAKLIQRKPLALRDSLDIAAQVAEALAEAHARDIIHRDVKPHNIMLTARGKVKVMDFGLALVLHPRGLLESNAETESLLTEPGAMAGTAPYMSPEQINAQPLDSRSDIFSFGAVLYEMVSGRRLFDGESAGAILSAVLTREPAPLARYATDVPLELERIVRKCLSKDRERRYQTMRDVATDLDNLRRSSEPARTAAPAIDSVTQGAVARDTDRGLRPRGRKRLPALIALGLIVLAAAGWLAYALLFRGARASEQSSINSLAVLPLENLSGDPAQEYFADGMTEALIGELSSIGALKVISRTSVMQYKGTRKTVPEIARELKVDGIVEGSVMREGNHVRITVQLIHAPMDRHLWSQSYTQESKNVLALQGEVARAIAGHIRVQVSPSEESRLSTAESKDVNPEAFDLYLRGRELTSRWDNMPLACDLFLQATEKDPNFAPAHGARATCLIVSANLGFRLPKRFSPSRKLPRSGHENSIPITRRP